MRRLLASGLALALAVAVVAILAGTPAAQTGARGPEACRPDRQGIPASDVQEGTGGCETDGRPIVDGAAGAVLPPPGEGVYVEALTREGAQELKVVHLQNGEIEVGHVGDESDAAAGTGPSRREPGRPASAGTRLTRTTTGRSPGSCDTA